MIQVYPKSQFERNKKEYLRWLDKNWKYMDKGNINYSITFGNILRELKVLIEEIKRNEKT